MTTSPTLRTERTIQRIERLIFLLEEFTKLHDDRQPDVQAILQKHTRFNMNHVYVGRRDPGERWLVSAVGVVGLAALDPWFHRQGLSESIITKPTEKHETLDVGGVMLQQISAAPIRVHIDCVQVSNFFGLRRVDWRIIIDPRYYQADYLCSGAFVRPHMVRDRILRLAYPERYEQSSSPIDTLQRAFSMRIPEPYEPYDPDELDMPSGSLSEPVSS